MSSEAPLLGVPRWVGPVKWLVSIASLPLAAWLGAELSQSLRYDGPPRAGLIALALALLIGLPPAVERHRRRTPGSQGDAAGHGSSLPILVAVVALLGYGSQSAFDGLILGARGKATVGKLGAIRGALSLHYGDAEGAYPEDLADLIGHRNQYLDSLPEAETLVHRPSDAVMLLPSLSPMDTGGWGYVNNPYDRQYGTVFVDCTHTDARWTEWTAY